MKIIIIGAGEVGFDMVSRLAGEDHDITIIESDAERAEWVRDQLDVIVAVGDGSDIGTLKEAGIESFDLIIAVTGADSTNLVVCMLAHQFGVKRKIARVTRYTGEMRESIGMLQSLTSIDSLINPAAETADEIMELFEQPWASEVVSFDNGQVQLVGTRLTEDAPMAGKTLTGITGASAPSRFLLVAVTRNGETIIPRGDTRMQPDDLLFMLGRAAELEGVARLAGRHPKKVGRVMVVGGGEVGAMVAERLEKMKVTTTIIEKNKERCWTLAHRLAKTLVIHGDGTDTKLLKSEDIADIDHFVAVTDDEETNVIMALLVKRYNPGCSTICLVKRAEYMPLVREIGVDAAVSSRVVTINAIMKYVRRGHVLSVATLKESEAEIIEIVATAGAAVTGTPLRELDFPADAIIGAVVRDENTLIPGGDTVINAGDRVIVFALPEAIEAVERLFAGSRPQGIKLLLKNMMGAVSKKP